MSLSSKFDANMDESVAPEGALNGGCGDVRSEPPSPALSSPAPPANKNARRVRFESSTQTSPTPKVALTGGHIAAGASLLGCNDDEDDASHSARVGLHISLHELCASIPNASRVQATDKPASPCGSCFRGGDHHANSNGCALVAKARLHPPGPVPQIFTVVARGVRAQQRQGARADGAATSRRDGSRQAQPMPRHDGASRLKPLPLSCTSTLRGTEGLSVPQQQRFRHQRSMCDEHTPGLLWM